METLTIPVVTLTKVKYIASMSEETSCFQAVVCIDGIEVGSVSNDGHGGSNRVWPYSVEEKLAEIAKLMPPIHPEFTNDSELLIGQLLSSYLIAKDLKKLLQKRIVFTKSDHKIYQSKSLDKNSLAQALSNKELLFKRLVGATSILNLLPFEEALALFEKGSS